MLATKYRIYQSFDWFKIGGGEKMIKHQKDQQNSSLERFSKVQHTGRKKSTPRDLIQKWPSHTVIWFNLCFPAGNQQPLNVLELRCQRRRRCVDADMSLQWLLIRPRLYSKISKPVSPDDKPWSVFMPFAVFEADDAWNHSEEVISEEYLIRFTEYNCVSMFILLES